jgi:hypothetical protein
MLSGSLLQQRSNVRTSGREETMTKRRPPNQPSREQTRAGEKFDPKELQREVDEMRAAGKLPPMEEFVQQVGRVREKYRAKALTRRAGTKQASIMMPEWD